MPLPKPNKGESQSDFVSRCMGDEMMKSDYGDQKQRLAVCYTQFERKDFGPGDEDESKAVWSTAYINNLPDSAFLYIEPGGKKDGEGKTAPRSLRHFPVRDSEGNVDVAHVRNALSRIPQSNVPASAKASAEAKAKRMLDQHGGGKDDPNSFETKDFAGSTEFKADDDSGEFSATFAYFNVVDKMGDVTLPGAIPNGKSVAIAQWKHKWDDPPAGRGVIHADESKAWVEGKFNLKTSYGRDTYEVVRDMAELQQWSYGYRPVDKYFGMKDDRKVRFLKTLDVFEVSPVLIGAGNGTKTDSIKSGLTFVENVAQVLDDLDAVIQRAQEIASLRGKADDGFLASHKAALAPFLARMEDLSTSLNNALKDPQEVQKSKASIEAMCALLRAAELNAYHTQYDQPAQMSMGMMD